MKKVFFLSVFLIVAAALLFFNSSSYDKPKEESVKKEDTVKLKMAHNLPLNSALHEASVLFAQKVREISNNKIQIDIYPNQQLGNDYQMVEMAREGKIDILLTPSAKMSVSLPCVQYADLPFLFPSREDAYELLDGEPGKMILKKLGKIDLIGVAFWENGFKHFTGNTPLTSPEDFKDKKIRIMKSRIIMEQFNALGAKPIPIDFHSTKKALEDRVVDGQENPLVAIVNMDFHKVQSNLTISEHAYLPYIFTISKKTLRDLPIEIQNILIDNAREVTSWEREETLKREKAFLDTIKKEGVKIHTLNNEEKKRFRDATEYIVKMYEDVIGSDIISKTEDILYNKYKPDDTVVFGVDADLSMGSRDAGLAIKRGVELAVDKINGSGGLLGKKVTVIAKDHKSISTQGIKNIEDFIADPNVKALIGGKQSAIIASEIKHIQESKKPYISPWAASSRIINNGYEENYLFRVSANDNFVIKILLNEVLRSHSRPLVIVENSIWGRGALKLAETLALEKELGTLDTVIVNRGENDFSNIIKYIREKDIDSILMVLNTEEGTNVVNALSKNDIFLPIVSHWGIIGGDFFKNNENYLKKADLRFIQSFSFVNNPNQNAKELFESYLKKYGKKSIKNITAPNAVAQAYDATLLLFEAVKKANSFEGPAIKEQLEKTGVFKGVVKTYENPFNKKDHEALEEKDFFFAKFNQEGIIIPVKK